MDPVTIGTAAVALLGPYLIEVGRGAAKKAGEQGLQKVEDLLGAIRDKLDRTGDQRALTRLEAKPDDAVRQQNLAQVLDEAVEVDPEFRRELERRTETAKRDERVAQIVQIYGNARVGNVTAIAHTSGDVHIGTSGATPPT